MSSCPVNSVPLRPREDSGTSSRGETFSSPSPFCPCRTTTFEGAGACGCSDVAVGATGRSSAGNGGGAGGGCNGAGMVQETQRSKSSGETSGEEEGQKEGKERIHLAPLQLNV